MKTYLKSVVLVLFMTSSWVNAAPNPASQNWVTKFVQDFVQKAEPNAATQNFVINYVQNAQPNSATRNFVINYVQSVIPSLTYHAGPGIEIDANKTISTVSSNGVISYIGSPTQCTTGTDCPAATTPQNVLFSTVQVPTGVNAPVYNSSTGAFTIQASGIYMIQYSGTSILLYTSSIPAAFQEGLLFALLKNGQPLPNGQYVSAIEFKNDNTMTTNVFLGNTSVNMIVSLLAGDVITLAYGLQPFGSPAPAGGLLAIDASTVNPPGTTPPAFSFYMMRLS